MPLGKPSISDPRDFSLRAFQSTTSNTRQRIEALEAAIVALQNAPGSAATLAALQAQINSFVRSNGTVTSVGATVPSFLSVSGTPITTSGTLAFSLANQTSGYVFAGPVSGGDAAPTFRPLEWYYDLPLFSTVSFTSGLDGSEIVMVERYGNFYWTTTQDIADLAGASAPSEVVYVDVAGDRTLQASDFTQNRRCLSTSGGTGTQNIIVPADSTLPLDDGSFVLIYVDGAAGVQVTAVSGVSLRVRSGLTAVLGGRYAAATLFKRRANEWFLVGDLAA